jgi:hypothetical protein
MTDFQIHRSDNAPPLDEEAEQFNQAIYDLANKVSALFEGEDLRVVLCSQIELLMRTSLNVLESEFRSVFMDDIRKACDQIEEVAANAPREAH